ncbi:MAG TPA: SDR family NAD(P)-dependent oxidoreductase [bacterium]|nr:SDR family NAD(P)-dependent oxidoreductase [bacterium]
MAEMRDKVVWITGGGTGIGRSAALAFAREGARVALLGQRLDPLREVAQEVQKLGSRAQAHSLDVANRAQVREVAQRLLEEWQRVDVLVNNAGMNVGKRRLKELAGEDWDRVVAVNLTGAFNMVQAVLPPMRAQRDGLIINVSSIAGKTASALAGTVYSASKHGMVGLSHAINLEEGGYNIRATSFCPGEVNTPILDKRPIQVPREDRERMMHPDDLAQVMRMLALLPARTCVTEVLLMPTYRRQMQPGELG